MKAILIIVAALAVGYWAGRHDVLPAALVKPARVAAAATPAPATPAPDRQWMYDDGRPQDQLTPRAGDGERRPVTAKGGR